jgi:hypothetical protein
MAGHNGISKISIFGIPEAFVYIISEKISMDEVYAHEPPKCR